MDFKPNSKYFIGANWPVPAGIACVFVGVLPLLMILFEARGLYWLMAPGVALIVVGLVLILVSSGGKTNEAGFDEQIKRATKSMQDDALRELKLEEKHVKVIPLYDPCSFGEYDFSGSEALLVKRGSDGKFRSNYYSMTMLLFTQENLCVYNRRFGFTEDMMKNTLTVLPYISIDNVRVEEKEFKATIGKNKATVKYCNLDITAENGETIVCQAHHNDADIDSIAERVNALVAKKKKAAQTK